MLVLIIKSIFIITMSKFLSLIVFSLFLIGCTTTIKPGQQVSTAQDAVAKQEKKIDQTYDDLVKNDKHKRVQTSVLAQGIQYSLQQVTNAPIQVETAKNLNERVISIVGSPHLDEIKRIKATIDLLNSSLAEERKKGEELLGQRDTVIDKLQKEKSELKDKYDDQLWQMTDKAKEVAKESDAKQATIDSMSGMFGLNAVFWGLKKFFFSCLTAIIIFVVVFALLRILASVHPAAGAAFSIFNMLGSGILSLVKGLTPKAFEMANFASKDKVDEYKSPLTKIVDVIQELKEKQKESPDRVYPLTEVLKRFDKEMDKPEKDLIDDILKEQKWIK
jgi:septal ring factor EnvC (AmiA/AmiB activator)